MPLASTMKLQSQSMIVVKASLGQPWLSLLSLSQPWIALDSLSLPQLALACLSLPQLALTSLNQDRKFTIVTYAPNWSVIFDRKFTILNLLQYRPLVHDKIYNSVSFLKICTVFFRRGISFGDNGPSDDASESRIRRMTSRCNNDTLPAESRRHKVQLEAFKVTENTMTDDKLLVAPPPSKHASPSHLRVGSARAKFTA